MFTETGYHGLKFKPRTNQLVQLLPHRRHLIRITSFLPGEKAEGLAEFKEDSGHFLSQPILLASEIMQALLEIAEVAIRSSFSLQKFAFLGFGIDFIIRQKVPIRDNLQLPVFAQKIEIASQASTISLNTHGKIKTALLSIDKKKIFAEAVVRFKLQQL